MLPRSDAPVWMDAREDEAVSWPPGSTTRHPSTDDDDEFIINSSASASLSSFRSMLEPDSFINNAITTPTPLPTPSITLNSPPFSLIP
ncbi:UNVERIFIED_CONTAM: hypothetical protein Sradi_4269500 [Sesamum radiatum]|uniref:Uncharacterized protein n=1 Tax=Sesamum radiatum TaxID=300843 RepID=A0AAW2P862_SESRA